MEVIVQDVKPDIGEIPTGRTLTLTDENRATTINNSRLDSDQKGIPIGVPSNNNTIKILTHQQAKSTLQHQGQLNSGGTVYITGGSGGGGTITTASPVRPSTILTTTLGQVPQTMAKSSGLSIVHVTLPQSVIQSPSVIQSASGQIQLSKGNVILVSKPGVIQTTGGALQTVQFLESQQQQLHSDESLSNDGVDHPHHRQDRGGGDRKRRDILTRRPSYRKILNDLGGAEITASTSSSDVNSSQMWQVENPEYYPSPFSIGERGESSGTSESSQDGLDGGGNILIGGQQYPQSVVKVISTNTLGLSGNNSADSNVPATSLQTITMTNAGTGGTIVQYAHPDGQPFYVPVGGDLQTYTIRPVSSASSSPSVMVHGAGGHHVPEEATRKREIRLLKNREAARECRRKKKEYIKCLENRVAVLENQNKALIDELKSLKELYCQHKVE